MIAISPELLSVVYPIIGLTLIPDIGVVIQRKSSLKGLPVRGNRKAIRKLSKRSLYNMILTVRSAKGIMWKSMLTLTYSEQCPVNGKTIKRNLDYALRYISRNCYSELKYFWFMEFQERGAPHYHVIMNFAPNDGQIVRFVAYWIQLQKLADWQYCRISDRKLFHVKQSAIDFNTHINEFGHYDVWQPLRKTDGAIRYALKYASKAKQKTPPFWFSDVGRFWGTNLPRPEGVYVDSCEEDLRQHLANIGNPIARWDYLPRVILYRT